MSFGSCQRWLDGFSKKKKETSELVLVVWFWHPLNMMLSGDLLFQYVVNVVQGDDCSSCIFTFVFIFYWLLVLDWWCCWLLVGCSLSLWSLLMVLLICMCQVKGFTAGLVSSSSKSCGSGGFEARFPQSSNRSIRSLHGYGPQVTTNKPTPKNRAYLNANVGMNFWAHVYQPIFELWSIFFLDKTAILHEKKVIFRETFARRFAEPFCHPIFRKNIAYLSRNFRPPNRGAFLSKSFAKKKSYFREPGSRVFRGPLLKHFNGHPLLNPLQGPFDRSSFLAVLKQQHPSQQTFYRTNRYRTYR